MVQEFELDISEEEYKTLPPDEKERFVFETLKEVVSQNRDGVTKSEILSVTPFGRKTIDKHLEKLVALNEAYVRRMGGTDVYYPNGRLLHANAEWTEQINGKTFRLTLLQNLSGQSIYLQDIEEDDMGEEAKGGILIPRHAFDDFIDWLEVKSEEVKRFDE